MAYAWLIISVWRLHLLPGRVGGRRSEVCEMKSTRACPIVIATVSAILISLTVVADWEAAMAAYAKGDYQVAAAEFAKEIEKNKAYGGSYYMLGMCNLALGHTEVAIGNLGEALERDQGNPSYTIGLAQAKGAAKQHKEAYELLRSLDPAKVAEEERSTYALLLGRAAYRQHQYQEAAAALEARLTEDDAAPLHDLLGKTYIKLGKVEPALTELARAFELDPRLTSSADRAIDLAIGLAQKSTSDSRKLDLYSKAMEIADRLIEVAPGFDSFVSCGEAALGAKQLQTAIDCFRSAYKERPQDPKSRFYLGRTLGLVDQEEEAIAHLRGALASKPDADLSKLVHGQLGRLLACRLELDEAAEHYRKAGDMERAQQVAEIAASSGEALVRHGKLRRDIRELQGHEQSLLDLEDSDGARAVRTRMAAARKEIAGIEENLAKVREALCQ
jgi:tetratricopeptide (TPR) repeat protein